MSDFIEEDSRSALPDAPISPVTAFFAYMVGTFIFYCFIVPLMMKHYVIIINRCTLLFNQPVLHHAAINSISFVTIYLIALIFISASFNTKAMGGALYRPRAFERKIIYWQKKHISLFYCLIIFQYLIFFMIYFFVAIFFNYQYYPKIEDNYNWDGLYIYHLFICSGFYFLTYILIINCTFTRIIVDPSQYYIWKINIDYELPSQPGH